MDSVYLYYAMCFAGVSFFIFLNRRSTINDLKDDMRSLKDKIIEIKVMQSKMSDEANNTKDESK